MSWFSSFIDTAVDFVSGGSGGSGLDSSMVSAAVGLGGDVLGATIAGNANEKAAQTVAQGYQSQAEAIAAGNEAAQQRFDTIIEQGQGSTDYLRRIVAGDPYQLTPEQQTGRKSVAREATNSLAASGLRGAGRSGVAVINAADGNYYDKAVTSNIGRADSAAQTLSSRSNNAAMTGAQYDANTGVRLAGTMPEAADVQASADIANAGLAGAVMGSLSSFVAGEEKDRSRDSRYKEWKKPDV